jgi:hypothetical protein
VLQIALLVVMHDSVGSIITALTAVQGVLLLVVLAALFRPVKRPDELPSRKLEPISDL